MGFIPVGDPTWIFPASYLFEDTIVFSMYSICACCSVPKPFIQIQMTNKFAGRAVSRLHAAGLQQPLAVGDGEVVFDRNLTRIFLDDTR